MPEPVLRDETPRSPVPAADLGDLTGFADETARLIELAELDEQLIAQLIRRVRHARGHQLSRRAAGLPATSLTQENAMLRHYTARLGEPGAGIALAILDLSRPPSAHSRGRQTRDETH